MKQIFFFLSVIIFLVISCSVTENIARDKFIGNWSGSQNITLPCAPTLYSTSKVKFKIEKEGLSQVKILETECQSGNCLILTGTANGNTITTDAISKTEFLIGLPVEIKFKSTVFTLTNSNLTGSIPIEYKGVTAICEGTMVLTLKK